MARSCNWFHRIVVCYTLRGTSFTLGWWSRKCWPLEERLWIRHIDAESAAVYVTCPSTNILSTSLQLQNTCNHQRNHWSHDRYFHNVFISCGIDLVIFFKALHRFLETFNWRWTLCQETCQKGTGYWECWPTCCLFCGGLWTSWHMFQGILDFAGKYVGHFAKKQAWNNPSSLLLEKAKCQTLKWTALRTYVN